MKIEIKKEQRINGDIWYVVYTNNAYETSFTNEASARELVDKIKHHLSAGIKEAEIILSETI